jgi:membrane fusion protein (multidrug efflux system)
MSSSDSGEPSQRPRDGESQSVLKERARAVLSHPVIRTHFFLVGALSVFALIILASGVKLAMASMLGVAGAAGAAGAAGGHGGHATPVSVVAVAARPFADHVEALGVAKGLQSVTLTSSTTELVTAVRFKDGAHVAKNQILVELKAKEQDAGVAQAVAALNLAKVDYGRWKRLADAGIASTSTADQYEAAYKEAQANLAAARARLGDRYIRAPFAGSVGLTDIAPGSLIAPGTAIVTLDDISSIRVDFDVPDRYLPLLKEGAPIVARSDTYPDRVIEGKVAKVDSRIDVNTRAIKARAEFPNPNGDLRPGMLMHVLLQQGARVSVAAPEAAVAFEAAQPYVFLVSMKGLKTIAVQRDVVVGARDAGFVEITSGLKSGDRIVADGLDRVQPNAPIRVTGARSGAGKADVGGKPGAGGKADMGANTDTGASAGLGAKPTMAARLDAGARVDRGEDAYARGAGLRPTQ